MKASTLVALSSFRTPADALLAQGVLKEIGIESMVRTDDAGGMYPAMGRAELLVRTADVEPAREALQGRRRPAR